MKGPVIRGACSNCESLVDQELVTKKETIEVRNEPIEVEAKYLKCTNCGDEVYDTSSDHDPLKLAYVKYRDIHGLLQPEQIKEYRECHGLTQLELSKLIGLGVATLSRYENGALQEAAHDNLLRLAMEPSNLLELVEKSGGSISEERKSELLKTLSSIDNSVYNFEKFLERYYRKDVPKITNGYKKLNREKLYETILFFCNRTSTWKTKLNKLLFYTDFKFFKEHTVSLTGAEYIHLQFGPVPDKYELHYTYLDFKKETKIEELFYSSGEGGEIITSLRKPNLNLFTVDEIVTIDYVCKYFSDFSASQISNYSHEEEAFKQTQPNETISYQYANSLTI